MIGPTSNSAEDAFRAAVRVDSTVDTVRLAKELGVSNRARRRLERELEAEGVLRSRFRWRALVAAAAVVLGAIGLWAVFGGGEPEQTQVVEGKPQRRPLSPEAAAVERSLYDAIDQRDPAKVQDAAAQLGAEDEPIRLAALRYLVTVDAKEHVGAMLALVDDESDRVRTSAIQLIASFAGQAVDDRLASVLADPKRALSERSIAVAGLEGRTVERPELTARLVLPALLDDSLPLRVATARLLTKLTGRDLLVDATDKVRLHASWRNLVGVAE